jgi:hypothetical protein
VRVVVALYRFSCRVNRGGKWITRASKIERAGGKSYFCKLLDFLDEQVTEWGSLFAKRILPAKEEGKTTPDRVIQPDHRV